MTKVQELAGELLAKRTELATLFEKKTGDGKPDWSAEERDKARALNTELNEKSLKLETLKADEDMETKNAEEMDRLKQYRVPGSFSGRPGTTGGVDLMGTDGARLSRKSAGDMFLETKSFKEYRNGFREVSMVQDMEVKTLIQTTNGFDPFVARQPNVALTPQQMPKIIDLLPTSQTTNHSVKWMLEDVFTNAAAVVPEAGLYPEAALHYTEQLSPVVKIAVFIPVTDEQFEDAPRMRDLVNNRLELMLRQKLDFYLAQGTGAGNTLTGLLGTAGTQAQARGTDPTPSAIFKAMTKVRTVAFSDPNGAVFHPTDWQNVKLLQTADGLYIWGHPSADTPDRIWGLPVVQSTYQTLGTATVADFNQTEFLWRKGVEFQVSNSHVDYFTHGLQAIRADMRVAFIVTRPSAICPVSGL